MLKIQTGPLPAVPVPLGGGAIWRLRPATSFEVTLATVAANKVGVGLAVGEDAVERAGELLGDEFDGGDFTNQTWVSALVERLVTAELAFVCSEGWSGVGDEDGNELPVSRGTIAMLLRDPKISRLVSTAINASVHIEVTDEKK